MHKYARAAPKIAVAFGEMTGHRPFLFSKKVHKFIVVLDCE
jgi:hypothetical protein